MTLQNQPQAAQAGTSGNGLSRAPAHHLTRETGCKAGSPEVMTAELPNGLHQFGVNQMPIVIMKTTFSPIAQSWIRPHAVWEGTKQSADKWCKDKNGKATCNTHYEAVTVKTEKNATNNE